MSTVTIYHNPRCTKSRQTLALLRERGVEPEVVEYLKDPPDRDTLRELLRKLGRRPIDVIRRKEAPFKELGLAEKADDGADRRDGRAPDPDRAADRGERGEGPAGPAAGGRAGAGGWLTVWPVHGGGGWLTG